MAGNTETTSNKPHKKRSWWRVVMYVLSTLCIVAVGVVIKAYIDMQKIAPAEAYEDLGVFVFVPEDMKPLQVKGHAYAGSRARGRPEFHTEYFVFYRSTDVADDPLTADKDEAQLARAEIAAKEAAKEAAKAAAKAAQENSSLGLKDRIQRQRQRKEVKITYSFKESAGTTETSGQRLFDEGAVTRRVLKNTETENSLKIIDPTMSAADWVFDKKVRYQAMILGGSLYTLFFACYGLNRLLQRYRSKNSFKGFVDPNDMAAKR